MGYSMNKVILIGNVGNTPRISQGTTGKRTATFSVATTEKWKNSDGSPNEVTEWHNIFVLAEHAASFVANYIGKGDLVTVEGQLQTKQYKDRDGTPRKATSVVVKAYTGGVGLLRTTSNSPTSQDSHNDSDDGYDPMMDDVPF